jgi:hypothetical protein
MLRLGNAVFVLFTALSVAACCKLPLPSGNDDKGASDDKGAKEAKGAKGDKVFNMDHPCDNSPGLTVTKVVLTETETSVHLKYRNLEKKAVSISTAPAGQADTFFIEASDQIRRLGLTRSSGIAVAPNRDTVQPAGVQSFVLYFPPIEPSWGPIDLHEGEVVKKGSNYWNFTDIELK